MKRFIKWQKSFSARNLVAGLSAILFVGSGLIAAPASASEVVVTGQAQSPWVLWVPQGVLAEIGETVELLIDEGDNGVIGDAEDITVTAVVEFVFRDIPFHSYFPFDVAEEDELGNVIRFTSDVFSFAHIAEITLTEYSFIFDQIKVEEATSMWLNGDSQDPVVWVPATTPVEVGTVVDGVWLSEPLVVTEVLDSVAFDCSFWNANAINVFNQDPVACPTNGTGLAVRLEYQSGGEPLGEFDYPEFMPGIAAPGAFTIIGELVSADVSGDVIRDAGDVERVIAAPYGGPILNPAGNPSPAGGTVAFNGSNLDQVTGVSIDGQDCSFEIVDGELVINLPANLAPGNYDLNITSDFGNLRVQAALVIEGTAEASGGAGIKRTGDSFRIYYFDPVNKGKVQFFVNGKEIAWVNATTDSDPKLRSNIKDGLETNYLVRELDLTDGKNIIEVFVDGERVKRVAYTLR